MSEKPYSDDIPTVEIGILLSRVACHSIGFLKLFPDEERLTGYTDLDLKPVWVL